MFKVPSLLLLLVTMLLATPLELGHKAYEKGNYQQAMSFYLQALKSGENPALVHINMGNCAFQLENLPEAATQYRLAVEYAPDFFRAQYNLVMTCYLLEDLPEALVLSLKALEMEPENSALKLLIATIYREFENQSEAIFILEKAVDAGDTTSEIPRFLGTLFHEIGAQEEAVHWFQKAINSGTAQEETYLTLASIQEKRGNPVQAELIYLRAMKQFDSPVSHFRLIQLMIKQNNILSALHRAEGSIRSHPKETEIALLVAESAMEKRWYTSAKEFYLSAFQNGDTRALPGLQNLIHIFRSTGNEKSAQEIEKTILNRP